MQVIDAAIPESGTQAYYQEALDNGRFLLQHCESCRRVVFFPRELCPVCGSERLQWRPASGEGVVYAVTTVRRRAEAGGDFNLSLVELREGVRMMSRVEGVPADDVAIGMPVRARVAKVDGKGLVLFRPAVPAEELV
ncbi:MAG: Zn-ribbon domain-containing OB-fold protein [Pigmentiphaga sp.]